MKLKPTAEREILEERIAVGIRCGYARAFKHSDKPSEEHIEDCVYQAIWCEIDEKFDFAEPTE